jgi:hypothetical protein
MNPADAEAGGVVKLMQDLKSFLRDLRPTLKRK